MCQVSAEWVCVVFRGFAFSRREASFFDPTTGEPIIEEIAKRDLYTLIDQVMETETKPMFDDDDLEQLSNLAAEGAEPVICGDQPIQRNRSSAGKANGHIGA